MIASYRSPTLRSPALRAPPPFSPLPCSPSLPPPQRPVIQQQEHQRPGHQHRFGHQPQGQGGGHRQVANHARAAGVPGVGPNRQQAKQPAEHVLPLGDPGHRFDVQRMHREYGGHQCARPHAGRHCPQHQEQQQGIGRVQGDIDQVHPRGQPGTVRRALAGLQHLGVGHQREPGERMPMRRDMASR